MILFSRSCFEHEEFNFSLKILTNHLHRVALKPIGSAGVVTLQGIADALLISNFFLSHITEAAILPERSRQVQVSLLRSQVATQLNHLFLQQ